MTSGTMAAAVVVVGVTTTTTRADVEAGHWCRSIGNFSSEGPVAEVALLHQYVGFVVFFNFFFLS